VVDAEQFLADPDEPGLTELKLRQIAFSDLVILNKVDLAGRDQLAEVKRAIGARINRVRTIEARHCDVPYDVLLGAGRFDPGPLERAGEHPDPLSVGLRSFSFESERALSLRGLRDTIRALPGSVYRCKGIVDAVEHPDRRVLLQGVGRRLDVSLLDPWGHAPRRSWIVAIGADDPSFDPEDLEAELAACATGSD